MQHMDRQQHAVGIRVHQHHILEGRKNRKKMTSEEDNVSICTQVEEVIKCAICWETPIQPKVLPCQHSFCLRCIHPAYVRDVHTRSQPQNVVQCPMCRHTHQVPKKGVVALPTDHRTNVLKDIVTKKRHLKGKKLCCICTILNKYTTATYFCLTCGSLLCSKCCQSHQENGQYQMHVQVEIFTRPDTSLHCTEHPTEYVQNYCLDCEHSLCKACMHGTHRMHRLAGFLDLDDADHSSVDDIIALIIKWQTELAPQREYLTAFQERNNLDGQQAEDELQQVQRQIQALQQQEEEAANRVMYYKHIEEKLEKLDAELKDTERTLNETIEALNNVVQPLENYDEVTITDVPLRSVQSSFSKIKFNTVNLRDMEREYMQMRRADAEVLSHFIGSIEDVPASPPPMFSGIDQTKINANVSILWKCNLEAYDVQFLQDGSRGIICTGQALKWKLNFVDFQGSLAPLPYYLSKYSDCECRVVTSSVTSSVSITHRTEDDGLYLPFTTFYANGEAFPGSILTSRDQISLCSLAVTKSRNITFAFMENKDLPLCSSLKCHSLDGKKRWCQDTSSGTGPGELYTPYNTVVDHLDRLIVSDHRGKKINIYTGTGRHLLTFPKEVNTTSAGDIPENEDNPDPRPSGICVDSRSNIYVAFPTHSVISKFSPNGDFIKHVVCTVGKPRGISLLEDRYLAVGTWTKGLFLYDLHGDASTSYYDEEEEEGDEQGVDDEENEENEVHESEEPGEDGGNEIEGDSNSSTL